MDVTVIGSCNIDLVSYVSRLPVAGETIIGSKFVTGFGGKGANPCVVAARLGAKTTMVSKVGNDTFGKDYKENLEKNNVNIDHVSSTSEASTGVAPIFVNENGENSIVVVPGANKLLSEEDLEKAKHIITNSKIIMCQLEITPSVTLAALKMAKAHNVKSLFNLAPAQAGLGDEFFSNCDILVVNESEAEMVTGIAVPGINEAKKASDALLRKGCQTAIVTLGENGAVFSCKDGSGPQHVPTPKVTAVDTTGAGDAFCGSLAFFLSAKPQLTMEECVYRANVVAGLSVQHPGTQTSYPYRKDLSAELLGSEEIRPKA